MDIGILESISSLEKSFHSSSRITLDDIQKASVLDVKLASQGKQLVELDLCKDQDDEGEIMLLAMILLQLHGVKLPNEDDNDLLNKKKRQRTSPDQLAILEQIFQTDKMPNQQTRVQLAGQLGMSSRRVQIWFQNKRAKVKRSVSRHDGDCPSPFNALNQSSSSMSPPSSPSSPSELLADESPILSPSLSPSHHHPYNNIQYKKPLQLLDAIISQPTSTNNSSQSTPNNNSSNNNNPTIIDNTTKQLKAQQMMFSFNSPFVENQPVLTASY